MFLSWEEPDKFVRASLVYMQMNMVCFFLYSFPCAAFAFTYWLTCCHGKSSTMCLPALY